MRTTLDIADDVMMAAKELARREKKTAGQVISELARRALQSSQAAGPSLEDEEEEFFGFRPLPARGVVVTPEMVDWLLEDDLT